MDKDDGKVADKDEPNINDDDDSRSIKTSNGMKDEDGSHANNIGIINASNTRIKKS